MSKRMPDMENSNISQGDYILGCRTPDESDLQDFESWKKRQRNSMVHLSIFFLIFPLIFITFALKVKALELIAFGLIFAFCDLIFIKGFFDISKWEMEYCNYGIVIFRVVRE